MTDLSDLLTYRRLSRYFPRQIYPQMRPNQEEAFRAIAESAGSLTLELPPGTGKTVIGYVLLRVFAAAGLGPVYYLVPNRTLVDQLARMFPEVTTVYGRSEYDCLYYGEDSQYKADEIPCLTLIDCPHRVDQDTGQTKEAGATPCPYYQAKFQARSSQITVCTFAFFLFNNLFRRDYQPPAAVVIDETHQIAKTFRNALSYEISDWHLRRSVTLLERIGAEDEAAQVQQFLRRMISVLRQKPQQRPTLLEEHEIATLMDALGEIDDSALRSRIGEAIADGQIDVEADRLVLTQLERLTYSLRRYVLSLEYSLPAHGQRAALNYITYAYSDNQLEGDQSGEPVMLPTRRTAEDQSQPTQLQQRVNYRLIVKSYYVAPLIRKLLAPMTLAYSATIGDNSIFGYETGIQQPFRSLGGAFPVENRCIYLPVDTPDLSARAQRASRGVMTRTLRRMARMVRDHGQKDIRSLVLVVSERERQKFLELSTEEGVDVVSYGPELPARQAMARFLDGDGVALVGTVANFGEGIDLPAGAASVIHVLRPGFPDPRDPQTMYEERRFRGQRWAVWQWRVMIEALQASGRNVRSITDLGATIFWSQQFRRFLYHSLPAWLQPAYRGELTLEQVGDDVLELLGA